MRASWRKCTPCGQNGLLDARLPDLWSGFTLTSLPAYLSLVLGARLGFGLRLTSARTCSLSNSFNAAVTHRRSSASSRLRSRPILPPVLALSRHLRCWRVFAVMVLARIRRTLLPRGAASMAFATNFRAPMSNGRMGWLNARFEPCGKGVRLPARVLLGPLRFGLLRS